ncbi:elongator complex protein 1-like [Ptychodera flava]|uniref:elongator complex protein 1-like n=1 Tax=Ptychodera flava TaxID=63121 RepID=UPI003969E32C
MRNLELRHSDCISGFSELHNVQCMTIDCDTGQVYAATCKAIVGLDPSLQQLTLQVSLVEEGYVSEDGTNHVVGIQHLPDQLSVCVATQNGDVLLCDCNTQQLECVGSVESGLTSMTWSPDQELVVLTTSRDTVIMMTKDFDPIIEVDMHTEDWGEQKPVTVGWGRKETQFHGSIGKAAARQKEETADLAKDWDDRNVRASWRGDGQFFAISTIHPQHGYRTIRVWNRECVLQYSSEIINGLEQALAWKPSGSLIASSQRLQHRHDIVFMEKNGLKHGEFTLPFEKMQVKVLEVLWNSDSSVLAVWLEDLPPDNLSNFKPMSYLQLWTVNNYHWYLKQTLEFSATEEERLVAVQWDPEHVYRIHIICYGGNYYQHTWSWATHHSNGMWAGDNAYVAVIDGARVLLSPFRSVIIPPPMCAYYLQLPQPANQVFFGHGQHCNDIGIVLSDSTVMFYHFTTDAKANDCSVHVQAAGGNGFNRTVSTHQLISRQRIMNGGQPLQLNHPLTLSHFTWIKDDTILAVAMDANCADSRLYELQLLQQDGSESQLVVSSTTAIDGRVYGIHCNVNDSVVVQLIDGTLLRYNTTTSTLTPWTTNNGLQVRFPQPCVKMNICQFADEEVVLGLTERYRFYVNDREIVSNCTSFAVHDEYVILTTHTHTCRCINLNNNISSVPKLSDGDTSTLDESVRRVERGSRIVVAVPNDTKVILQMPRGNLETIHPRALMLSAVRKYLDALQYKDALIAMRKHRIDMNLIYDHDPKGFLENVDKFVSQLDDTNHINLFLADLKAEDMTCTLYKDAYPKTRQSSIKLNEKVDTVCDGVRQALLEINPSKYFQSIITTHIKKTKPELEIALNKIKSLRDDVNTNRVVTADEALKYIICMVDVNELYNVALGTYDFDLVLMVAEKSQMDPKEYLPFLNKLRKLESSYQKYTIDKHLKRYSKALVHISQCTDHWQECLELIEAHQLYVQALKLFKIGTLQYQRVGLMYAEHLLGLHRLEEAGLMYMKCNQDEKALEMYKKCGNWRQAMCLAIKMNYNEEQISQMASQLASFLHSHRQFTEAAYLLEYYVHDVEEAAVTLIEGCLWEEALFLMYRHNRLDLVETNLKPAILQGYNTYTSQLESLTPQFERYKHRLSVVRETKEKRRQGLFDEDGVADKDGDLFSDTSSIGRSSYSQYTASNSRISGRSSKNRRKTERKKYSLKEGSEFEDLALLEAISGLMTKVDQLKGDMGTLIRVLVQYNYDTEAHELQMILEKTIQMMEKSVTEIWKPEMDVESSVTPILGPKSTANSIAQSMMQSHRFTKTLTTEEMALRIPPKINKDSKWKLHQLQDS